MDKYKLESFEQLLKLLKEQNKSLMTKCKEGDVMWAILANDIIHIDLFQQLIEIIKSE